MDLQGRNLLKETDLTAQEFPPPGRPGRATSHGEAPGPAVGPAGRPQHRADLRKASTRTRSAFEVAAHDEGGHVTYLGRRTPISATRSRSRTRRGSSAGCSTGSSSAASPGIGGRPSARSPACRCGTGSLTSGIRPRCWPTCSPCASMRASRWTGCPIAIWATAGTIRRTRCLVTGALARPGRAICAPDELWPASETRDIARSLAVRSGASLTVTADTRRSGAGSRLPVHRRLAVDGEPEENWDKRIDLLLPYQVKRGDDGGHREPGGEVPALPARAAQPGH